MKIVIGSDEAGFALKEKVKAYLEEKGQEVTDIGCYSEDPVWYPEVAETACMKIVDGSCERGILICGTGIGMAITANKVAGIRATVAHDIFSLERSILSNNCQVITFGARVVAYQYVTRLIDRWLEIEFKDGPSTPKIEKIMEVERKNMRSN